MKCKFTAAVAAITLLTSAVASASPLEWEFTFTQSAAGTTVTGAFSIPVADFAGNPSFLPNSDITDMSLTLNGHQFALSDVLLTWGGTNTDGLNFLYNSNVPTPYYFTLGWLVSANGCDPSVSNSCTSAIQIGNLGLLEIITSTGENQVSGSWASTQVGGATPLPAALPLFAAGLGALGLLGWRRKRKAQAVA